jgi:hypothetical protein
MVVLPDRNELYSGDGNSVVHVISLENYTIVANVSTGGQKRADEMAYSQNDGIVMVTNPAETPPYVTLINVVNRTVAGKIVFPDAQDLEQPAYNPIDGLFYVSVPSSNTYPGGAIATVNVSNMSVVNTFPLPPCNPAGIAFGPQDHIFVGCSEDQITTYNYAASFVVSTNGSLIANVSGISGIDQVTYDPVLNLWYASAYQMTSDGRSDGTPAPVLGIVNASGNALVQTIVTDNVTAHSVAYDPNTGDVAVPVKAKGIEIFKLAANTTTNGSASGTSGGASGSASPTTSASKGSAAALESWSHGFVLAVVLGVSMVVVGL